MCYRANACVRIAGRAELPARQLGTLLDVHGSTTFGGDDGSILRPAHDMEVRGVYSRCATLTDVFYSSIDQLLVFFA